MGLARVLEGLEGSARVLDIGRLNPKPSTGSCWGYFGKPPLGETSTAASTEILS